MISLIIPCYNEEDYITNLLKSIEKQTLSKSLFEVIIVDNGSKDETYKRVTRFMESSEINIKLISEPVMGVSRARNTGASHAEHDILVFLDADNLISDLFLEKLFSKFTDTSIGAATIKTLAEEKSIIGRSVFVILDLIKYYMGRPFGKSIIRKRIFNLSGGFNESIALGENPELLIRIKQICLRENQKFIHFTEPIRCSLRRFNEVGYVSVLSKWVLPYIGLWGSSYRTMSEIQKIKNQETHNLFSSSDQSYLSSEVGPVTSHQ